MPGRRPASRPYRHPRATVIARPQRVPPQQTSPSPDPPASPARGLVPLTAAERALLHRRRWREPGREYRWHGPALLVALLLHALFALVVWQQMRPRLPATPRASRDEVLEVRFITSAPPVAAVLAPPAPSAASRPPAPPRHEPPARNAMTLQVPAPPAAPRLYDQQGQPLLPAPAASAPAPDYVPNLPRDDARIMQHRSPVEYRATRFDKDWGGGNAFDSALQKLVDKTTVKQTIRLPRGVRIHCGVSLAMLAGGCGGEPPPPPSAKDGDERLSMAPATPLDGAAHAPPKPDEAACIAMYRAGKPLAWGCPVDTPARTVDAELRGRAAGAARGH